VADALQPAVDELVAQLLSKPPFAMARIKENLRNAARMTAADYIVAEADNFIACRDSADHKEAMRAFIEKRPPRFGAGE
jgi:2-(1,2-epoxy-1,2-dihydrophenyl)acetyl-CoA isomerase